MNPAPREHRAQGVETPRQGMLGVVAPFVENSSIPMRKPQDVFARWLLD
jgi:hypothetical protein